jgi:uncharacterized protein
MLRRPVIDGLEFARTGSKLQGAWPLADLPRLRDTLRRGNGSVAYELQGVPELRGRPALRLKVAGTLLLTCQRCLEELDYPLSIEVALLLAASQAEIDAEPFEVEMPECIVAGREMPVLDLVEDELVLAVPIAPRHERCAAGRARPEALKHTPFAGLRGLLEKQ